LIALGVSQCRRLLISPINVEQTDIGRVLHGQRTEASAIAR
jgi:hypothetical protein